MPTHTAAKGWSLHIGLNTVNPRAYGGWDGQLNACEADADDMRDLFVQQGFQHTTLMGQAATRKEVLETIMRAAQSLSTGDYFALTYSGHGGQLPDRNGDEEDGIDETWCLWDGQLVDDQIHKALSAFMPGVRVIVLSDSCHSGTVIKALQRAQTFIGAPMPPRYRAMPNSLSYRAYKALKDEYDDVLRQKRMAEAKNMIKASVISISGCQDNQFSQDGVANGLFTGTLLRIWDDGRFLKRKRRTYADLHRAILRQMPPDQTPAYCTQGRVDLVFEAQIPFTL